MIIKSLIIYLILILDISIVRIEKYFCIIVFFFFFRFIVYDFYLYMYKSNYKKF